MSEWIWYPGELELRLLNESNARRSERGVPIPPLWPCAAISPCVKFAKKFVLKNRDELLVRASGRCNIELDGPGKYVYAFGDQPAARLDPEENPIRLDIVPGSEGERLKSPEVGLKSEGESNKSREVLRLEPGEHTLSVLVYTGDGRAPCLFVGGREIGSDSSWHCTLQDGTFVRAACGGFADPDMDPNDFRLSREDREPVSWERHRGEDGVCYALFDFGRETFGTFRAEGGNGQGRILLCLGESREEAEDFGHCELLDEIDLGAGRTETEIPKGFRYVAALCREGAAFAKLTQKFEYRPQPDRARVQIDDPELQNIWDTALETFSLCTREFFLDGIKRDRWVWAGDAAQAVLINPYVFFDRGTAGRTLVALGGKPPVRRHINTIVDYTLFWMISVGDWFGYTGDEEFLRQIFPQFQEVAAFVLTRLDEELHVRVNREDWLFIDWAEGLPKELESYSFLQILLCRAFELGSVLAGRAGERDTAASWRELSEGVRERIMSEYWSGEAGAFLFGKGEGGEKIFRQPNVLAVLFGIADEERSAAIRKNVLENPDIPALKTPYMRFYELAAMCETGLADRALRESREYFGGMLAEGATTFWEYYDPTEKGAARWSMYGRRYGKSLCHTWGAAFLYLFGRYFAGLAPEENGKRFLLRPVPDFPPFEAEFPLARGRIFIRSDQTSLFLRSDLPGRVIWLGTCREVVAGVPVTIEK